VENPTASPGILLLAERFTITDDGDDHDIKLERCDPAHGRPPEPGPTLQDDAGPTILLLVVPSTAYATRAPLARIRIAAMATGVPAAIADTDMFHATVALGTALLAPAHPSGASAVTGDVLALYWHPREYIDTSFGMAA